MPELFLSDIYYNMMIAMGDPLGMLDPIELGIRLPFVISVDSKNHWAYNADPITPASTSTPQDEDDPITGMAARAGNGGANIWHAEFTEELYEKSLADGTFLGMPWSTKVLPGTGASEGLFVGRVPYHYRGKQTSLTNALRYNEWSGELLAMKMPTLGIVAAVSVGGYFGGKYLWEKYS